MFRTIYATAPSASNDLDEDSIIIQPMPNTLQVGSLVLVDELSPDAPSPALDVLGCWAQDGEVIAPLDVSRFKQFLAPIIHYNEDGEAVEQIERPINAVHNWAGWPELTED